MHIFSDWIRNIQNQETKSCEVLFSEIIEKYRKYTSKNPEISTKQEEEGVKILKKAYDFAKNIHKNQKRDSGVDYFTHPLIVTSLLQHYEADEKILAASLLHDAIEDAENVVEGEVDHEVKKIFGEEIYYLVDGVSKVSAQSKSGSHKETLQKIFSHSAKDARILLIKIADRIHNICTIGSKIGEEKRTKKITETLEIFVLACEKLQLDYFQDILLNACSYYLFPEKFKKVEDEVREKTAEAEQLFEKISADVKNIHREAVVEYSPYHIANLLRRGDADTYSLKVSDLFYVNVVTNSKEECYQALSWLSQKYHHKTALMSDLIANPPENSYRALKTSMIVYNSFLVRFHILSQKMKKDNMKGVFNRIQKGENSLPFFSQKKEENTTENFVEILQHDMLSKKKAVHNAEKGQKFIPVNSCALDAVIHLFPSKFIYISQIYREGIQIEFSDTVSDNDILECEFSEKTQADVSWMKHLFSSFGKIQLQNFLKKEAEFPKSRMGKKMLQSAFDIFKEGEISSVLHKFPEISSSFFAKTREELYVFVAEGLVSSKEVLIRYEEIKSQKKTFFGRIKKYFSSFLEDTIENSMNISVSSKTLSNCHLVQFISTKSIENSVLTEKISVQKIKNSADQHKTVVAELFSEKTGDLFSLFSALKLEKEISSVSFLPSRKFYTKMIFFFSIPFLFNFLVYFFLFPENLDFSTATTFPLLLIFLINSWGYLKLSHYLHVLRKSSIFMVALFLLNLIFSGLYLSLYLGTSEALISSSQDIFALVFILIASLLPSLFLFIKSQDKFLPKKQEISLTEWEEKKREKIKGYIIRFFAVIIWGLQPLYIKYTPMNTVDIDYRMFFMAIGGVLASVIILLLFLGFKKREYWKPKLTINKLFWIMVVSELVFVYLMNQSLLLTSSTNMIIFNNFAPLFALLIAIIFWRKEISYLKEKSNILAIIGVFLLGGIGSSLLFYNDILYGAIGNIKGDILALMLMATDVVLVVAQIRYAKYLQNQQSIFLNLYAYGLIGIFMIPLIITHFHVFSILSSEQILYAIGAGLLAGTGQILNYEAFRRMDGFIAFLMFNISILITFTIEAFILGEIIITYFLVFGGLLSILASVIAEYINTKCERRELKITKDKDASVTP